MTRELSMRAMPCHRFAPVQRLAPGQTVRLDVASSHYSTKNFERVSLTGSWPASMARTAPSGPRPWPGSHSISASRSRSGHTIELRLPETTMLCTLLLSARTAAGAGIAENFVHYFVSSGYPVEREETSAPCSCAARPPVGPKRNGAAAQPTARKNARKIVATASAMAFSSGSGR